MEVPHGKICPEIKCGITMSSKQFFQILCLFFQDFNVNLFLMYVCAASTDPKNVCVYNNKEYEVQMSLLQCVPFGVPAAFDHWVAL